MKIHIVSLQRTGSKALEAALERAMPDHYRLPSGDALGEFFHCWSFYGYKFGMNATKPFDPAAKVWFRTHPEFYEVESKNFCLDNLNEWEECDYEPHLLSGFIQDRIDVVKQTDKPVVVKTQLASLMEEVFVNNDELDSISSAFDETIFLTPSDPVHWLCSNFLCDQSGVFVSCIDQREAGWQFQKDPVTIPSYYIDLLSARLARHRELRRSKDKAIDVWTSDLKDGTADAYLSDRLFYPVRVLYEPEFSSFNYSKMIANYSEVAEAVKDI